MSKKGYQYFDTPEGQDIFEKFLVANKTAGVISLAVATADVMMYSHPKGYMRTLARYAYICLPLLGMSSAFVLVKNMSCQVREQDDKLNWILGALAAGGIFGAWRKSALAGFTACSLLTGAAILKKHALQNGWSLMDVDIKHRQGGVRGVRHDFTLTSHRPGNWTTGETEE